MSVLNTYLQICLRKSETEDAVCTYEKHKSLADYSTNYLMALVSIQEQEFDTALSFIEKALVYCEKAPMYHMMKGVILFWQMMEFKLSNHGQLLPPMYHMEVFPEKEIKRQLPVIIQEYERAYELARAVQNKELCIQILGTWLNCLSVSKSYREEAKKIAAKLLEWDAFQWQAILYLYMTGDDFTRFDSRKIKLEIENAERPLEYILACLYVMLGKGENQEAYALLKRYRYEFQQARMMDWWYELSAQAVDTSEEKQNLWEQLEKSALDLVMKMRIQGLLLEKMEKEAELIEHMKKAYETSHQELDLMNLLHCCERFSKWIDVENYSLEWKQKFSNSMGKISYIRSLAMQNRQKDCLLEIDKLRMQISEDEIPEEILFLEAQAFALCGELEKAIPIAEDLWKKTKNQSVLFLLAKCYFLSGEEEETVNILQDGLKAGIRNTAVFQMLAEHYKFISVRKAAKYAKKACMISENESGVLMWAMHFLFEIGASDEANELLLKLRSMKDVSGFQLVSVKEVKEIFEKNQQIHQERYQMYQNCEIPYHIYVDATKNASYSFLCKQLEDANKEKLAHFPLFGSFGGHRKSRADLVKHFGETAVLDFSSILLLYRLGLWEKLPMCFKKVYLARDIYLMLLQEKKNAVAHQPDVAERNKEIMEAWEKKKLEYIPLLKERPVLPAEHEAVELNDWIPYTAARENGCFWIKKHLFTDMLEKSYEVPDEIREAAMHPYELLTALERKGDIRASLKKRYASPIGQVREEVVAKLCTCEGKIPILVDEIFLHDMYEMDAVDIISQKCQVYVFENMFEHTKKEQQQIKLAYDTAKLLDEIKDAVYDGKEEGFLCFCELYQGSDKQTKEIHTSMLFDEFQYAVEHECAFICDDRMVNSFDEIGKAGAYTVVDVLEWMHEKNIVSEEKYVNLLLDLMEWGYCYMIPPYQFMKYLIFRTEDRTEWKKAMPDELKIVCRYLSQICVSSGGMRNTSLHGKIPESVLFMCYLQKTFEKLLQDVWKSDRSNGWKWTMSDWLLQNFSEFGYDFFFFETFNSQKVHYRSMQLANFLSIGLYNNLDKRYQKEYYQWLFGWLDSYFQIEIGMEERVLDSLAELISVVNEKESEQPIFEIGIGVLLQLAAEDMPEYYAQKICSHPKLQPLIEKFEDSMILLDRSGLVEKHTFFKWLEQAIQQGLNQSITVEKSEVRYTITWVADEGIMQGFFFEWTDAQSEKHQLCYKVEGALLMSKDKVLRRKGLYALSEYLTPKQIEQYEMELSRKENVYDVVSELLAQVRNHPLYREFMIYQVLEKKQYRVYEFEHLLPEEPEFFEHYTELEYSLHDVEWYKTQLSVTKNPRILLGFLDLSFQQNLPEAEEIFRVLTDVKNKSWYQLYVLLVRYFCKGMYQNKFYAKISESQKLAWAQSYAGTVLQCIAKCERAGMLRMSVQALCKNLQREASYDFQGMKQNLTYTSLIVKPLLVLLNEQTENQISKQTMKEWMEQLWETMKKDVEFYIEAISFCSKENCQEGGFDTLLDFINELQVKYGFLDKKVTTREGYSLFLQSILEKEEASEYDFTFLVMMSEHGIAKEWQGAMEGIVRKFPYTEEKEGDTRIALCIGKILLHLDKEFVSAYLPTLKKWVYGQLTSENIDNISDIMAVIEFVSMLECPENVMEGYVQFWEQFVETGNKICKAEVIVDCLKNLTMVASIEHAQRLQKVVRKLYEFNF